MAPPGIMKLLSLNYQGLGNPLKVHNLKGMCSSLAPDVLFVMETKNDDVFVKKKLHSCGYVDMILVKPLGSAGGLALSWREHLSLFVIKYASFLHVSILDFHSNKNWSVLLVFASCVENIRAD